MKGTRISLIRLSKQHKLQAKQIDEPTRFFKELPAPLKDV
ncbi:MAG: Uncharacterised protein [Synechococcus sp. CC9902]|nr:MAG: Uncharacterised protein [Synechococcus sp. CC9902]